MPYDIALADNAGQPLSVVNDHHGTDAVGGEFVKKFADRRAVTHGDDGPTLPLQNIVNTHTPPYDAVTKVTITPWEDSGVRVFVAIRPPEHVLAHLDIAVSAVAATAGGGQPALRWVPRDQRHITLAFFADVPSGAVAELTSALRQVAAHTHHLELRLAGAGTFLRRTLWVGVHQVSPAGGAELTTLMAQAAAAGSRWHEEDRNRRRAHLTLGRLSARARSRQRQLAATGRGARLVAGRPAGFDIEEAVHALSIYRGPEWIPHHIEVVASELGAGKSGGAHHETLAHLPIGAGLEHRGDHRDMAP